MGARSRDVKISHSVTGIEPCLSRMSVRKSHYFLLHLLLLTYFFGPLDSISESKDIAHNLQVLSSNHFNTLKLENH